LHTGEARDANDIARRAEAGDAAALASMIRYEERLARGAGIGHQTFSIRT